MLLGKLQGYDIATGQYSEGGATKNLPKAPFIISSGALPVDYDDFGILPENWYKYAYELIGSAVGFRDYQSWRIEIRTLIEVIAGADYVNWNILTDEQKIIALRIVPTKVIDARGFTFFNDQVTALIGNGDTTTFIVTNYLDKSTEARSMRYDVLIKFAYQYLGKNQGLRAELLARGTFTDMVYIERGVLYNAEDGIDGFGDWILSNVGTTFENTGLKAKINDGTFSLGGAIPTQTFLDALIGIIENGLY